MLLEKIKIKFSLRVTFTIIIDVLLASVSFLMSYTYISTKFYSITSFKDNIPKTHTVYGALALFVAVNILANALLGGYTKKRLSNASTSIISAFLAVIIAGSVSSVIVNFYSTGLSVLFVFSSIVFAALLLLSRVLHYYLFYVFAIRTGKYGRLVPTLIIGAGFTGKMVYHELIEAADRELNPVCFVDDNKELFSTTVCGLPVFGPTVLIPELCKKYKIGMIVFAIPSCSKEQRRRILANCNGINCDVRIVPSLNELSKENEFFKQSQGVNVEKLLGRDSINIENKKVADFINNKVCLVTGGGGSIGSELCRQIVKMNPERVIILDIYENNAYAIQQELLRNGFGREIVSVEIASVRDKEKMRAIFNKYNIDVIFHASAHKHVPLMEDNPEEAIKNNVEGTYNIAHMAHKYGVEKMVLISTDKAVNPTNVMGASKRLCEMVMQYMSQTYKTTKYTSVRFGNVLGSNGSVIPLFTKQIEAGGPVTVTHPDIIRYFMTIPEAVSLVLEAGTMSDGGEVFVLDMGEPVKIVTLAENLIKMYGFEPYTEMPIEFCGLRAGEKLYEELLMNDENLKETHNNKIFINDQLEVDCSNFKAQYHKITAAAKRNDSEETVALLHQIVPTFKTPEEVNDLVCSGAEK